MLNENTEKLLNEAHKSSRLGPAAVLRIKKHTYQKLAQMKMLAFRQETKESMA